MDAGRMTSLEIAEVTGKAHKKWERGQYRLTPEYEGLGLAKDRLFIYYSKDGKQKERTYLVWTTKGAEMIDKMIYGKKNWN